MAEKLSKTARASLTDKAGQSAARNCPTCGTAMIATKVIKSDDKPGGMYWVCPKDDYRIRI